MRKNRQQPQKRELFPSAGYWLVWGKITADDFDTVEKRLEEISVREEQINHLLVLKEHFQYEVGQYIELISPPGRDVARSPEMKLLATNARLFRGRLESKIEQLRNLQAIEKQMSGEASPTERSEKEIEDEPAEQGGGDLPTTAQQVMLLYYLVLAANEGRAVNKSALGRLLEFFTGQKPATTKAYWQNPTGRPGKDGEQTRTTKENMAVVRSRLEDLELPRATELLNREAE